MIYLKLKYEVDKMSIIKMGGGGGGGGIQWREKLYGGGQNFSEGDLSNFWFNKKVPMKNLI